MHLKDKKFKLESNRHNNHNYNIRLSQFYKVLKNLNLNTLGI